MSIYISAAHKSSGKTTLSLGLCALFESQNLKVQSFKKGPDYIDPIWLKHASGQNCYNLDFWTQTHDEIKMLFNQYNAKSDISIIEGNKGLYDGIKVEGGDSNADLAKLLNIPVILVIDVLGITRGVAPLLKGYQLFDEEVNIAGVILNKAVSERHATKVRQAVEYYSDIPVLGVVARSNDLIIDERHLGLIPANEENKSKQIIDKVSALIKKQVDYDKVLKISNNHKQKKEKRKTILISSITTNKKPLKIAVAQDKVFGFYYKDDFETFKNYGVELVFFDTLKSTELPQADALFIGGGFPEMFVKELSENKSLLVDIKTKIEKGLPTKAECGGLMYLCNTINNIKTDEKFKMVGVIEADITMSKKPVGRGYIELEDSKKQIIKAHEFHYSKIEIFNNEYQYAYKVKRGYGIDGKKDGLKVYNLLATYAHFRHTESNLWIKDFIEFIRGQALRENK
jgi:cobyrinic acid a,c-diamide synthase